MDVLSAILELCAPFSDTFLSLPFLTLQVYEISIRLTFSARKNTMPVRTSAGQIAMSSAPNIIPYHTICLPRILHHLLRVGATKRDIPNQKQ